MNKYFLIIISCLLILSGTNKVCAQPLSNNQFHISSLKEAIKDNKYDQGAYMGLCYYYSLEKDYNNMLDTMKLINKLFKKDENILETLNNYSIDFCNEGNYDIAEKVTRITLDSYKNDTDSAIIYSNILLKQNKISESISFLRSFLPRASNKLLIYDNIINNYFYLGDYEQALKATKTVHSTNIEDISYYFMEALALQHIDKNLAEKYLNAYLDKLEISTDIPQRITAAKRILKVISNNDSTDEDYINLVKTLKNLNASSSCIISEARYARKLFPQNSYFIDIIIEEYKKLGINPGTE